MGRLASLWVPGLSASSTNVAYIGETAPFRIKQYDVSAGIAMTPKKLAFGVTLTNEMLRYSSAEALLRAKLAEDLNQGLDAIMFGNGAASAVAPAGLLDGISTISVSSDTTIDGMTSDLAALAAAVAPIGGNNILYVASPGEAVKIATRAPLLKFPVVGSGALAAKSIMCIACRAVAVVGDAAPRIDLADESVVMLDDTSPQPITSSGTPTVMNYPSLSLWQADLSSIKITLDLNFALRVSSGAVALASNVKW